MKAMVPMLNMNVSKIQVAVLASRSHRLYPIKADYVGISMATTLHEHLTFDNTQADNLQLSLN
jgi:pyrimidine operon attenuation protein/uracil phosphoribosyltransferase